MGFLARNVYASLLIDKRDGGISARQQNWMNFYSKNYAANSRLRIYKEFYNSLRNVIICEEYFLAYV